jgi:hypothetical protein
MSDPITLGLAGTAIGIANNAIGLLKEARDAAKDSDDHDLKDKLSEVFDAVLELKEAVGSLREENADLRKQIEARKKLNWDSKHKLYFGEGDPDPYCPSCWDLNGQQIRLQPYAQSALWKHECRVCKNTYVRGG